MSANLEKKISRDNFFLSQKNIQEILSSYEVYDGNASMASKRLSYAPQTIIRYWRSAGFKIQNKGPKSKVDLINNLISLGYSQIEIAKKLGISRQAINIYINKHKLQKPISSNEKKYNLIKRLIEDGDFFEDIIGFVGMNNYESLNHYLDRHPKLSRPKRKSELEKERKIELIKKGLLEGLSQNAISKRERIPQGTVNKYVNTNPTLKEFYDVSYGARYQKIT